MSWESFNDMYMLFTLRCQLNISSHYSIFRKIAVLAEVKPLLLDCYPYSCVAYTTKYMHQVCPFCGERRFKADGKPQQQFAYFPIIPRLLVQGFFRSPASAMIKLISYRS